MRILVTGLCSLHFGRLEYGNIGNYYIVEPLFRELHRVFKNAEIVTTFQFTESFCMKENVTSLPLDIYYNWNEMDLANAYKEFSIAQIYNQTNKLIETTGFINEVLASDLVVDFSGDMWGDNADLAGENRFLINLLKDRVVQLLKKPIAMVSGSPGPFDNDRVIEFAKIVYKNFDLVSSREPIATQLLLGKGFDISRTIDSMCPAYKFVKISEEKINEILEIEGLNNSNSKIGFTFCGFNMKIGPYQRWPRNDNEYLGFASVIEKLMMNVESDLILLSHTNGFVGTDKIIPKQGRDYPLLLQLYELLDKRGIVDMNRIKIIHNIYSPAETKGIISRFDVFVSGRAHGAIAAYSQSVPCVILNYANGPVAHKLLGFSMTAGMEAYIADSNDQEDIYNKVYECFLNRDALKLDLKIRLPEIIRNIEDSYNGLRNIIK